MVFSSPLMLLGALAVGIPIALHFFFRSRYRTIPWAAMKFLLTSIEQTSRRLRFQELLLLLLRCLVLAALATALAQPGCRVTPGGGASGDPVDAVFLFDVSYSMGAADGPVDRLQRAKTEALAILSRLPNYSTVRVITCADRPEYLGPRSPGNLDQVRSIIDDLKLTSLTSDLSPGIIEAEKALAESKNTTELYLFSDMQKNAWDQQAGRVAAKLKELHDEKKCSIYLVRCGDSRRTLKNAAIVGITPQSGVPRPGERVGFAVLVRNTGGDEVKDLKLTLSVDGDDKKAETQQIDRLPPGETRAITLAAKLDKPGLRLLTAQLDHDDLPGDNRFDQVVLVRDTVNVLIIDGGINEREPEKSSSYFLAHALAPVKDNDRAKYYLQPKVLAPRLAAPAQLAKQDLCILVNVPLQSDAKQRDGLPADFVEELEKFVRQGKGLIVYAGDNVAADTYNRVLGKKHGLLPLPLKSFVEFPTKDEPAENKHLVKLNRDSTGIPTYLLFKEDNYYKTLGDTTVWKAVELDDKANVENKPNPNEPKNDVIKDEKVKKSQGPVAVALRFSNGLPAVVTKKVGAGEVVFIATSADPGFKKDSPELSWTDWPFNPANVPFVNLTVSYLLQEQTQVFNVTAGQQVDWRLPREGGPEAYQRFMKTMAPDLTTDEEKTVMKWASNGFATQNFQLRRPDGSIFRLGYPDVPRQQPVVHKGAREQPKVHEGANEQPVVHIADFTAGGIYRLGFAHTGQADLDKILDKKVSLPFAVIADLRDSENLESYGEQQLNQRLGFQPIHRTAGVEQVGADEIGTEALRRRDLTPWFLFLVLILAAAEVALAWICSRAW